MSLPNSYRDIKLKYGNKVNEIKNLSQKDWMAICKKLGLYVAPERGKGSHCAVLKDAVCKPEKSDCLVVTLPCNIYPNFQRDLVKKVIYYGAVSGMYTEEDFWKIVDKI